MLSYGDKCEEIGVSLTTPTAIQRLQRKLCKAAGASSRPGVEGEARARGPLPPTLRQGVSAGHPPADLSEFFDTIRHHDLMQCMARRLSDRHMLRLIKQWLKVPVEERDEQGKRRMSGGKRSMQGAPQRGVISPLLANIYMHRSLRAWRQRGYGCRFRAHIVNYADDFAILSRGRAKAALAWTRWAMEQTGLSLNSAKARLCDARRVRLWPGPDRWASVRAEPPAHRAVRR